MKQLLYILIVFFSSIGIYAQTDCERILAQKINLHDADFEKMQNELVTNFSKLKDCGLDEIDIVFLGQPPILSTLVLGWINDDPNTVTYQKLLDEVLKMKAEPDYKKSAKFYNDFLTLKNKKIDLNNWDNDSKLIFEIVKDERVVNSIYQLINQNPNEYETYGVMMDELNKVADSMINHTEPTEGAPNFYKDAEIFSYDEILKKAKDSGKPILIYFTSYADVNSRKMEDSFLYDDDIQEYIETNYYSISLYLDSKKEVPEEFIKLNSKTGKTMKTYGAFYSQIQEEKFNEDRQPYFAIIGLDGKILKTQGFTLKKKHFEKFLK